MSFKRIGEKRGVALIMAMWILTILVVVAASFAFMMRTEVKMAYHHRNEIKAYYIAMAGIESAIANLRSDNYPNEHRTDDYADCAAVPGGVQSNVSYGDGRYSLLVMDEQAKININSVNNNAGNNNVRNLLGGGYGALGDGGDDHAWPGGLPEIGPVYAAHIIDWADADTTRTTTGAATDGYEDTQYQASTPSRYCKDASFDTPDELVMVQEIDYRRYWGEDRGTDGNTPSGGALPAQTPGTYPGPDPDGSEANYILDASENGVGGYNDAGTSTVRMENLRNYVTVWSYIPTSGSSHPYFPYPDNTVKEATARAPINVNRVSRVTVRALYDPIYFLGISDCDNLYNAFVAAGEMDRDAFNTVVDNTLSDGPATRLERCAKSNSDPSNNVYNLDTLKVDMVPPSGIDPTPYVWTTETCFKSYTYKIESTGEVLVGGNPVATRKIVAVVNIDANNNGTIGPVKTLFWRDVFLEHQ